MNISTLVDTILNRKKSTTSISDLDAIMPTSYASEPPHTIVKKSGKYWKHIHRAYSWPGDKYACDEYNKIMRKLEQVGGIEIQTDWSGVSDRDSCFCDDDKTYVDVYWRNVIPPKEVNYGH